MANHLENRKNRFGRAKLTLLTLLLAVAGMLIIVTCSDQFPTDSSLQGTADQSSMVFGQDAKTDDEFEGEIDTLVTPDKEFRGLDSAVIVDPRDGGRLFLIRLDETSYFDVPAGGLDATTTIQIQSWETRSARKVELEFHCGPSGLTFSVPATFVLERSLFEVPSKPPPRTVIWELYSRP